MRVKPQSITRAYRADLAERNEPFGSGDDAWLAVGSLLEHAAAVAADDPDAARAINADARARALEHASLARVSQFRLRHWENRSNHPADAIIVLSEDAHDAGAPHMAAALLDGILGADPTLQTVTRGRVMSRRARTAWRLGWLGEAQDRASDLLALGEREREPELVGWSWVAFGALAQMRGNYPDFERAANEVGRIASTIPSRYLLRICRMSHMIIAGVRKDFAQSLEYGWRAYRDSAGFPAEEAETLQNMGQALLEAGYADAARAAFSRIIYMRLPARYILAALGGLALASAQTGRQDAVVWATAEVHRLDFGVTPKYPLAYALLECASACQAIGRTPEADAARVRVSEMADAYKFHELAFRAEMPVPAAARLDAPVEAVAREVQALEPDHLPEHVELAGVA